ncbi:hypothetical protein LCGC14_3146700 [marine sediment metagenome]|uniref:Uncharacterized protein n=1 Tax=marine sediment metagenome TaxID=412755 RepID=A0A0F8Y237_9ZZZZ
MGLFDGLNEAPMGLQRLYFKPGRFLVKLVRLKGITPAESFHGKGSFVVECEIYQTSDPTQPVGTAPAWVQKIGVSKKEKETAFGAIKAAWERLRVRMLFERP